MTLVATDKLTEETIAISDISQVVDNKGIYYISGIHDAKSLTTEPVKVSINGCALFKAYNVEVDIRQYRTIKVFP